MNTEQKIKKLIAMSPFHSVFVMLCISNQAKEILADKNKTIQEGSNSVIDPQVWIDCSEDAKKLGLVE